MDERWMHKTHCKFIEAMSGQILELTRQESDEVYYINSILNGKLYAKTGSETEPPFLDKTCLVSSRGTGFATLSHSLSFHDVQTLIGQDARNPTGVDNEAIIAALDSCVVDNYHTPLIKYTVSGLSSVKSFFRATLIASIVSALGERRRVFLIGAVHDIIKELVRCGHTVSACDMDESLRGVIYDGVNVGIGSHREFEALISNCSVVVATGMTLVNGTVHSIVRMLADRGISLILYCQSAAHLAPLLPTNWPLVASISEPFPNYFMSGCTDFSVFAGGAADEPITRSLRGAFANLRVDGNE